VLNQIYHSPKVIPMPTPPAPEFYPVDDTTTLREQEEERRARGLILAPDPVAVDPAGRAHLRVPQIIHIPVRTNRRPVAERVEVADALDLVIERFTLKAVTLAFVNVLLANGIDIYTQTINDLAEVSEEQ
jgi:hypothetical protein